MCMPGALRGRRGHWISRSWVMDGGGPPYEYLESNSSPWKSSPCSLITTESDVQTPV